MSQLVEGVDNEITLAFILLSGAAAIAVPWYFFRPRTNFSTSVSASTSNSTGRDVSQNFDNGLGPGLPQTRDNVGTSSENRAVNNEIPTRSTDFAARNESSQPGNLFIPPVSFSTEENITVKIKLYEVDNQVTVGKRMQLKDFKRYCFPMQTEERKNVRLIFNGRILQGETHALEFFGLSNGCTLHAQISDHQQNTTSHMPHQDESDLEIGYLFIPSITLALILGWVAVLAYDEIFSTISIVILALLSGIFILLAYVI